MVARPASTRVNSVRNDDSGCCFQTTRSRRRPRGRGLTARSSAVSTEGQRAAGRSPAITLPIRRWGNERPADLLGNSKRGRATCGLTRGLPSTCWHFARPCRLERDGREGRPSDPACAGATDATGRHWAPRSAEPPTARRTGARRTRSGREPGRQGSPGGPRWGSARRGSWRAGWVASLSATMPATTCGGRSVPSHSRRVPVQPVEERPSSRACQVPGAGFEPACPRGDTWF
jgi:hypothetical protein